MDGDDAADWTAAVQGDGEAFGRVYDRRKASVRRQAQRLLDRPADVEDAVAIVFLEAWRKRWALRLVDDSLLPWLLVTTTNVARNVRRGRVRYDRLLAHLPVPADGPDPADLVDDEGVLAALRGLSLADQQVLTLCVLEDRSERDAAHVLGVAPGTVKSRLHRAKHRLAHRLGRSTGPASGRGISDGA
ncbi:RNA polymerase sigma factor [uncultured Amnibacterium sp.]|uniref:RNA polymerase sigma factor n=1 Tax=uncultured Amnibacterium sp. TaxID=1631851 RepID=UPI0035CA1AE5